MLLCDRIYSSTSVLLAYLFMHQDQQFYLHIMSGKAGILSLLFSTLKTSKLYFRAFIFIQSLESASTGLKTSCLYILCNDVNF